MREKNIKIATIEARRSWLVSEPRHHITKCFYEDALTIETKNYTFINKPVYLGLSILEISKVVMYVFWYVDLSAKKQQIYIIWKQTTF